MIDHTQLVPGKQYQLDHGIGKLIGLEMFTPDGMKSWITADFHRAHNMSRFIFELDPEAEWCRIMKTTRYAAWGDQIKEVENEST